MTNRIERATTNITFAVTLVFQDETGGGAG
jgi:hypothetical protein